ncbi:uncharacterized protein LOC18444597 [Amborella trichopoda]|nr:uncharacterized protein LOC18444597 [Amborella trichopoda]|eukprot:XP_011627213.1 uncharacterized protein LOC18444597 [Amborella trichopoda]
MNFNFLKILPLVHFHPAIVKEPEHKTPPTTIARKIENGKVIEASRNASTVINVWGRSLHSFIPWVYNLKRKEESQGPKAVEPRYTRPFFRPYVARVPYHKGARAFLSLLFPRYGHYCGPNWSSGKDGGSLLWDKRPIDWLDFCCYCHDIGYDTHEQEKLLKADLAFLECLEKPMMSTKGDVHVAYVYKAMCITGLRNMLIPYRKQLLKLQEKPLSIESLNIFRGKGDTFQHT